MSNHLKDIILKIWRQNGPQDAGHFETHKVDEISDEASFLEMLDYLNEQLITDGKEAIVFDHDCREGICGTCSLMINGQAHGPERSTATCQLHMRKFSSGAEIVIEPWRAAAFPLLKTSWSIALHLTASLSRVALSPPSPVVLQTQTSYLFQSQ